MLGIGGNCVESPYYHAQSAQLRHRALVKPRHRRHALRGLRPGGTTLLDQRTSDSDNHHPSVIELMCPARVGWRGLFSPMMRSAS
jgi:hypothetical protein